VNSACLGSNRNAAEQKKADLTCDFASNKIKAITMHKRRCHSKPCTVDKLTIQGDMTDHVPMNSHVSYGCIEAV